VNVLESLEVVQKGVSGKYTWLGLSSLPACVERLHSEWAGPRATPVVPLVDELCDKVRRDTTILDHYPPARPACSSTRVFTRCVIPLALARRIPAPNRSRQT